jgi:hypothetical protein
MRQSFPSLPHPRLTNDLDIFLQDDAPGVAPMPAPLPAPRVPPGFLSLAVAGGQATLLNGLTTLGTEVGGQTTSPGGQTAPGTEAGGLTATPSWPHRRMPRRLPPRPRLWPPPTRHPRLHPCHAWHRRPRLHTHLPRLWHPNTIHVTLGLRGSHRHHLYFSSHH